jgi:type II secretory pathway component GspD/PulD (secretin)
MRGNSMTSTKTRKPNVRNIRGSGLLGVGFGLLLILMVGAQGFAQPEDSTYSSEEYAYSPGILITNVFYESDIRDALRDISVQAGIPIVTDPTVQGFVSLEVEDVPLEECLRRILAPGGYTFRKMEGYYLVGAAYPENPSFALLSRTKHIKPNYLTADVVPNLLSSFYEPFVKVDETTNTIVVTSSPEIIERLLEDLAEIDVPPRQVMIEALVTEFSKNAMRQTGVDWRVIGSGPDYTFSLLSLLTDRSDSTMLLSLTKPDMETGNLKYDLTATIQALAETGEVTVHANPRVVTLDGRPATIFLGQEEYYEIITGPVTYPYARLEMIKIGITLKIKPFVAENGDITVLIEPEVSDVIGKGATNLPVVTKRSVATQVRVKDGETITIGGLIHRTETKRVTKIPLLGDIPILGYFFSSTTPETDETEVVVFITPHLLEQ